MLSTFRKSQLGIIAFISLFILVSCSDQDKKGGGTKDDPIASHPIYMNCVTIDSAHIAEWVNKGWTDTLNVERAKKIMFQFYSPDAKKANKNMQLIAYPAKNFMKVISEGVQYAGIFADSCKLELKDTFILGNNYIGIKKLKILEKDGKKIKNGFQYHLIRPIQGGFGKYVYFTVYSVFKGVGTKGEVEIKALSEEISDPCPKFCIDDIEPKEDE